MQPLQAPPTTPQMGGEDDGGYGLTPFTLSMHLLNLVINKGLMANPQARVQIIADCSGELERLARDNDGVPKEEGVSPTDFSSPSESSSCRAGSSSSSSVSVPHCTIKGTLFGIQNPLSIFYELARADGLLAAATRGIVADLAFSVPSFAAEMGGQVVGNIVLELAEIALLRMYPPASLDEEGSAFVGFGLLVIGRVLPALVASIVTVPRDTVLTNLYCDVSSDSFTASTSPLSSNSADATAAGDCDETTKNVQPLNATAASATTGNARHAFHGKWSDTAACVRHLWKTGGIANFYQGWWLTAAKTFAHSTAYFGTFYAVALCRKDPNAAPTPLLEWSVGLGAAVIGLLAAQPFEVVRRRMMLAAGAGRRKRYAGGVGACLSTVLGERKGVAGLWQGASVSLFFVSLGTAANYYL